MLKPSNQKVLESYFSEINPISGEPKFVPPVQQQQHKRTESQAAMNSPRQRLLIRKVSKVSILSTTRKIDKSEVSTHEKLIPIYQNSLSTLSNTNKQLSANFISNVPRDLFPRKDHLPGPADYNLANQIESNRISHNQMKNQLQNLNQVSFGSSNDRNINFLSRDIACPFQDKSSTSAPDVGKYSKDSTYQPKQAIKTTLAGGVDIHKPILKSEMAKNYVFAKQFYHSPSDGKLVPEQASTTEIPGPGAYNPEYPSAVAGIQSMTEKRYQQYPFGSKDQRFKQIRDGVVTEQQLREQELQEDLFDHTKVRKKSPTERQSQPNRPNHKHYQKQITNGGLSKQEEMVQEFIRLVEQHIPQPIRHQPSQKSIKPIKSVQPQREITQKQNEPLPGPGAYQLPRAKTNGPSFGKAQREQPLKSNHYSGPADYQVLDTLERKSYNRRL